MKIIHRLSELTIFLYLFLLIQSELDDDTTMKAFSCYNIINKKYKGKDEPQPTIHSPMMLSCFLKISEEQSQKILSSMEADIIPLEKEEIDEGLSYIIYLNL